MTTLTGTGRLVRLILRRDRLRLSLWIGGLVVLLAVSAAQVISLYDTPERIQNYVDTFGDNPALVIFSGPGHGFDDPNIGVILVNEASLWMALSCGLMSVFLVNRHTRAEEDDERADLVRSTVVGRHAPIAAVMLVAVGANAVVSGVGALTTIAAGYPTVGALAFAASFGAVGIVFAAATAVTAQVASSGRAALGLGAASVGVAFVVRGIGDIDAAALSWATPFGWGIGVRAFAGERWWTLAGLLAAAATLTWAAFALSVRRDLGSGLVAPRAGRATATRWSTRPVGLAFRLQRASIWWWSLGLFLTGLVYGAVGKDVEELLADNPNLAEYLAQLEGVSIADSYLSTALRMMAMLASGYAVSSALRNRSDEAAGYAESMLAGSLSRTWWTISHLVVTVSGTVVIVLAGGLGTGLGYGAAVGDGSQVLRLVGASLVTLPAPLVLVGVAMALFGWRPRATAVAWLALAVVVVVGVFASVLHLPDWVVQVSPLEHLPPAPAEAGEALPIVMLSLLAVALVVAGIVGFTRRDLEAA